MLTMFASPPAKLHSRWALARFFANRLESDPDPYVRQLPGLAVPVNFPRNEASRECLIGGPACCSLRSQTNEAGYASRLDKIQQLAEISTVPNLTLHFSLFSLDVLPEVGCFSHHPIA